MKKKGNLIFLLLAIFFTKAYSQSEFKPEWNVGLGFGSTFSSVSFDPLVKTTDIIQFQGGVAIRYISERHLGLIAELNYSQQGWKQNFADYPIYADMHKLNYFDMPIMTHIYFGNKMRVFFNFGPDFGFLLSENEVANETLILYTQSPNVNPANFQSAQVGKAAERRFSYGLVMGLGTEFRSKVGNFSLEGRYNLGLSDMYNNSQSDPFARSANRVISVKLTYYTRLF